MQSYGGALHMHKKTNTNKMRFFQGQTSENRHGELKLWHRDTWSHWSYRVTEYGRIHNVSQGPCSMSVSSWTLLPNMVENCFQKP